MHSSLGDFDESIGGKSTPESPAKTTTGKAMTINNKQRMDLIIIYVI
jgi:RecA/RadA recombinase